VASGIAPIITAPSSGAAVPAGLSIVQGVVDGGGADGVAVSVNGFAALVHGVQWAARVPIAPGDNVLTAVARTVSGAEGTASVTVSGTAVEPAVLLHAEPSSGVTPLQVTWRLGNSTARPLVRFELDPHGTGAFAPLTSLDGAQSVYSDAGLRFPAVRATDDQGNVYEARTVVQVDDAQAASARFQALWAGFKSKLQAGDQPGALAHLAPSLRSRFEPILQQLGAAVPGIATALGGVELIDQVDDLAEAAVLQAEDGVTRLYFVYFRRDTRGQWLIQEM
jgi:hypothetical protein